MLGASPNPVDGLNRIANRRPNFPQSLQWLIFRDKGRQAGPSEIVVKSDAPQSRLVTLHHATNDPNSGLLTSSQYLNGASRSGTQPVSGLKAGPLEDVPGINMVDPASNRLPLADRYTKVA